VHQVRQARAAQATLFSAVDPQKPAVHVQAWVSKIVPCQLEVMQPEWSMSCKCRDVVKFKLH